MSVKNQNAIELSEQELDVVAGGVDESVASSNFPQTVYLPNVAKGEPYPGVWNISKYIHQPNPFPPKDEFKAV